MRWAGRLREAAVASAARLIAVEKSWRDAQVAILFGKASRKAAFATNDSGRYWRRRSGARQWGSASGVLAITRGPEAKMSAARAAGAQSDSTRHPKYNFRLPASFGNCVLIRARWFARSSGSTIAVAAWPSTVAPETPPTPISYRLARPSRSGSYSAVITRPGGACIPPSRALPVPARSPVTVLRCPEHVPSPSGRLPKAAGKSNFSHSMAVLSRTNTSCRYEVSCPN